MPIRIPFKSDSFHEGVIDVRFKESLEVVYKSPSGAIATLGVIGADGELVPDVTYEFKPYNRGWNLTVACAKCKCSFSKELRPDTWNKNAVGEILVIAGRDMESRALDFECYHIHRSKVAEQIRLFMEKARGK